ncbi:hypothetical protein HWV62_22305 [Athelia sp. TMB]|nr:hypothetical protein HWV62_22305 [Athelia sp. TMB]
MSLQQSAFRIRLPSHLEREHIGAMYRAFVDQTQLEGGQYFMVTPEISVDLSSGTFKLVAVNGPITHPSVHAFWKALDARHLAAVAVSALNSIQSTASQVVADTYNGVVAEIQAMESSAIDGNACFSIGGAEIEVIAPTVREKSQVDTVDSAQLTIAAPEVSIIITDYDADTKDKVDSKEVAMLDVEPIQQGLKEPPFVHAIAIYKVVKATDDLEDLLASFSSDSSICSIEDVSSEPYEESSAILEISNAIELVNGQDAECQPIVSGKADEYPAPLPLGADPRDEDFVFRDTGDEDANAAILSIHRILSDIPPLSAAQVTSVEVKVAAKEVQVNAQLTPIESEVNTTQAVGQALQHKALGDTVNPLDSSMGDDSDNDSAADFSSDICRSPFSETTGLSTPQTPGTPLSEVAEYEYSETDSKLATSSGDDQSCTGLGLGINMSEASAPHPGPSSASDSVAADLSGSRSGFMRISGRRLPRTLDTDAGLTLPSDIALSKSIPRKSSWPLKLAGRRTSRPLDSSVSPDLAGSPSLTHAETKSLRFKGSRSKSLPSFFKKLIARKSASVLALQSAEHV